MIEKNFTYKCKCSKCSHVWNTRKDALPDRCAGCNVTGWNSDHVEPEAKPKLSLVDSVRELPVADRKALFDAFELCCGMNRGDCVCPTEPFSLADVGQPLAPITLAPGSYTYIESIETEPEPIEQDWRFAKDAPQYHEDGNVYRLQLLAPDGKVRRKVQVDSDNHEDIIRIVK